MYLHHDDCIFEKTGFTIHGADNLADHFSTVLSSVVKEEITLINYMEKDGMVSVELQILLTAVKDGFYIRDRKKFCCEGRDHPDQLYGKGRYGLG